MKDNCAATVWGPGINFKGLNPKTIAGDAVDDNKDPFCQFHTGSASVCESCNHCSQRGSLANLLTLKGLRA